MLSPRSILSISPVDLCQLTKCKSLQDSVKANTPAIGEVLSIGGDKVISAFIELNIARLALFLNVGGSINPDQIQSTAELITEEFGNLTISDINLIFRRAKLGQWGKIYDRLDGQIILGWFADYYNERCEYCAQTSAYDGDKFKGKDFTLPAKGDGARIAKEVLTLTKQKLTK